MLGVRPLRVAFVNTYDSRGGAARAAFRLFQGVYDTPGIDARFFCRENGTGHPGVVADRSGLTLFFGESASMYDQKGLKRLHPNRMLVPFSVNRLMDTVHRTILEYNPDVIHLHWPHAGFLRIESLANFNRPIVWTNHDMWAFTGVCHYAVECEQYLRGCGACPLLRSSNPNDVSAQTFARKMRLYPRLNLHIVSPSSWLAKTAGSSPLLRGKVIQVIPNGLDMSVFAPMDKSAARQNLGLPQDRKLILFGADHALVDQRKGGAAFLNAFTSLSFQADMVVFGNSEPPGLLAPHVHGLGYITDDRTLAKIYSACDLYAFPSIQDNLPNTVMESLACGTPVLAFDIGGIPDMVTDGFNGFLVSSVEMDSFVQALRAALDHANLEMLGHNARQDAVLRFGIDLSVKRYLKVYEAVLGGRGKG